MAVWRWHPAEPLLAIVRLSGAGCVTLAPPDDPPRCSICWTTILTTNDRTFSGREVEPPRVTMDPGSVSVAFDRPAAVLLRGRVVRP